MIFQIGKNPEFTFAIWFSIAKWSGDIALPLDLSWWNVKDVKGNRNIDVTIRFLCFGFSLEIWKWIGDEK